MDIAAEVPPPRGGLKRISVVAYSDGDLWVAQCVEYDIAARADTLIDLPRAFGRALAANVCVNAELGRKGLDGIGPAPDHFRDLFDDAAGDYSPRRSSRPPMHLPEPHYRVAEYA